MASTSGIHTASKACQQVVGNTSGGGLRLCGASGRVRARAPWQQGIYLDVINSVVTSMRQPFLDEGMDESVLEELKLVGEACRGEGRRGSRWPLTVGRQLWVQNLSRHDTLASASSRSSAAEGQTTAAASSAAPSDSAAAAAAAPVRLRCA